MKRPHNVNNLLSAECFLAADMNSICWYLFILNLQEQSPAIAQAPEWISLTLNKISGYADVVKRLESVLIDATWSHWPVQRLGLGPGI